MSELLSYQDHIGFWEQDLRDWLPDTIFDAHVHVGPPEVMGAISIERQKEPLTTFTCLTWERLAGFYEDLFRGKTISGLIAFGFPFKEVDIQAANSYIVSLMKLTTRIKGFIIPNPKDTEEAITQFEKAQDQGVRFCGVKPYCDLIGKSNFKTAMPEFIPDNLLQFMDREGLIMMLHTSGYGVGTRDVQDFIRSVTKRYPNINIILAHMGRYFDISQFYNFMETDLLDHPSVYLEMSSSTSPEVYQKVLERSDLWTRLLFGSDLPYGAITGMECNAEGSPPGMFLTRDDYIWSDQELNQRFAAQRLNLTYNTYHTIKALKTAMDRLHINETERERLKNDIFRNNAQALLTERKMNRK